MPEIQSLVRNLPQNLFANIAAQDCWDSLDQKEKEKTKISDV